METTWLFSAMRTETLFKRGSRKARGGTPGVLRTLGSTGLRGAGLALAACVLPFAATAQAADAAGRPGDLCRMAIAGTPAARLPPNLLSAIGRVETGRADPRDGSVKAWPWSINAEGRGYWFNTKAEAIAAVQALRARNVASVDVGCMQVNLMHHPAAFASLDEAFDPAANVRYAAKFLGQLFAETGDWGLAAAYYHSRTPDRGLPYGQKVMAQMPGAARLAAASAARLAVSTEQLSLNNAWAATIQAAPGGGQAPGAAAVRNLGWTIKQAPPRSVMLASRH